MKTGKTIRAQNSIAATGTYPIQTGPRRNPPNGTLKGRGKSGCVERSHITLKATVAKLKPVPRLIKSPSRVNGSSAAEAAEMIAEHQGAKMGRAKIGMQAAEYLRQQSIARHGEGHARLSVAVHQKHRGQTCQRPELDQYRQAGVTGAVDRQRNRVWNPQFPVRNDAGEYQRDNHIEQRADRQGSQDADGQVSLRIAGFRGRRRHGLKADVGEEQD